MSEEQVVEPTVEPTVPQDPNVFPEPQIFNIETVCASGETKTFTFSANTIQDLHLLRPQLEQFRSIN